MDATVMKAFLIAAAFGAALVSGVFLAFSSFVMGALARLSAPDGIRAMQSINVVVLRSLFLAIFFATAALSTALLISVGLGHMTRGAWLTGAAAVAYLAGSVLVTIAANVPLNERLKTVHPDDAGSAAIWQDYLDRWTFWNHVRTAASAVAAVLFMLALS